MQRHKNLFFLLLCSVFSYAQTEDTYAYQAEIKALTQSEKHKLIFDENAHQSLQQILQNLEGEKAFAQAPSYVASFQQRMAFNWGNLLAAGLGGAMVVTGKNMP